MVGLSDRRRRNGDDEGSDVAVLVKRNCDGFADGCIDGELEGW